MKRAKVKAMTPERMAHRAEQTKQREIVGVCAIVGLPDAQRKPAELRIVATEMDGKPRPQRTTVRKLTRVERLRADGTIEPHEADACEWYANTYALGFDTVRVTANYGGAGRGGGRYSDAQVTTRYKAQSEARADYAYARSFLPPEYVELFEAVICRSDTIGTVGERIFAHHGRAQQYAKARAALRLCANLLHGGVGNRLVIR